MDSRLYSARRVVDNPEFYGGGWNLVTGRKTAQPELAKSPWAYACMHIRGQELANLPWHIKRGDKILTSHILIDMLTEFGPESNWGEAVASTEIDRLSYGAGFWLRDHDILKRLNPNTMKVNKTTAGISGFTQTINGKGTTFPREDITYFREYHPSDDLGFGLPVMEVIEKSVNAEIEALLMVEAYFKNDAIPGFLLVTDQDVPPEEARRVLKLWNRLFRGSRNKSKVGIAGKGLKPIPVGSSMKDNALSEIVDSAHNDICVAMRVPKILVGSMESATYVNLAESRKFLIEDVIIPRAIEYQNTINQDLVQRVDSSVVFEYAFDELQILQEDTSAKWERLNSAMEVGLISDDYVRAEMGYPEASKPIEVADKGMIAERRWQRKAVKALLRGDKADVGFETDNIGIDRQYVLHGRLSNAKTGEDVKRAFHD